MAWGKQVGAATEVKVQTAKITVTYQDFQNAPEVNGEKRLEIFRFPAKSEILTIFNTVNEPFAVFIKPTLRNVNTDGECESYGEGSGGFQSILPPNQTANLIFSGAFCPDDVYALVTTASIAGVNALTQGLADIYISYIVH